MKKAKQWLSFLLAMCIAMPSALAVPETTDAAADTQAAVSQEETAVRNGFAFAESDNSFDEGSGKHEIQIVRTGDVSEAASVTVVAYNMNAAYGSDYLFYDGDTPVEDVENATTLFEKFREDGVMTVAEDVDEAMLLGIMEAQEILSDAEETTSSEESEESLTVVSADEVDQSAQTIAQLEELNIRAAELMVDFEAGQEIGSITVEIPEDETGEYSETFFLVLTSESSVGDGHLQYVSIVDNEEQPVNTVAFAADCTQLEADAESGTAELWFTRTGDLATLSTVVLVKDGEPYGYVSFDPYQEEQVVEAEPGTYQLANAESCQITEPATAVVTAAVTEDTVDAQPAQTVTDGEAVVTTLSARSPMKEKEEEEESSWTIVSPEINGLVMNTAEDEADPILDSVPEYSAMPAGNEDSDVGQTLSAIPSWFSSWAQSGSYEDDNYIVVMGSTSNGLFKQGGHSSPSSVSLLSDNSYKVSTEGTGSRCDDGYCYIDSYSNYNMTGISAITTCYMVDDLDYDAEVKIGVHSNGANTIDVEEGDSGEITYSFNRLIGVEDYVYFENIDPTVVDDGCDVYFTNGFRMTKREYLFNIKSPEGLEYTGESVPLAAEVEYEDSLLYKKIGDGSSTTSTVNIRYTSPSGYPQTCVGFELIAKDGSTSGIISLDGTDSFVFDRDFLKTYEASYCVETLDTKTGNTYPTFTVRPIMEKVEVSNYEIQPSGDGGTIKMVGKETGDTLYKGEKVVFEADNTPAEKALTGVYIMARKAGTDTWERKWTEWMPDDSAQITVTLDSNYDEFVFQGEYEKDADMLRITYAKDAKEHGAVAGGGGVVVEGDEYVINSYYPLMAQPNDGYITKWESDGRVYYGDTFYYQLDGNSDHNYINVDFILKSEAGLTTSDISGSLSVTDVNMFDSSLNSQHALANTSFSIPAVADVECKGTTDTDGTFTISNFSGVPGGTYSMLIEYGDYFRYATFVYGDSDSYKICVPQYGDGIFFPSEVTVALDGTDSSTSTITLQEEGSVNIGVQVYNQTNSPYKIDYVALYFYSMDDDGNMIQIGDPKQITQAGAVTGNLTAYTYTASTSEFTADSYLYVDVVGSRTLTIAETDDNGDATTTDETSTISCGKANSGYQFINPNVEKSLPILEDVAAVPGAQSAYSVDMDVLDIPFCGCLDLSINGRDGAFYVRQYDANDPSVYYLMAGYTAQTYWGTTEINDRYTDAKNTLNSLNSSVAEGSHVGSLQNVKQDTTSDPVEEGAGANTVKKPTFDEKYGTKTKIGIYPAAMLRFTLKKVANEDDESDTDGKVIVAGVDAAIGIDELVTVSKPITFYGVPFYVCFTFNGQQYIQVQYSYNYNAENIDDAYTLDDDTSNILYGESLNQEDGNQSVQTFICVPLVSAKLKGGIGLNNLAGAYVSGKFDFQINVQMGEWQLSDDSSAEHDWVWDAGGTVGFTVAGGLDVLVVGAELDISTPDFVFGNEELYEELQMISPSYSSTASAESAGSVSESFYQQLEEEVANTTFSLAERNTSLNLFGSSGISSDVLMDNAYRGTQVKLVKLEDGTIMAVMLADNGAEEGSANFLSVAYAISEDGGNSWEAVKYAAESEHLQFGVEVHELNDRILITWSEGDLDNIFAGKDVSQLAVSDVTRALNAMDLHGRYFDKETGEPIGEAFAIAENTGVAMSMLDAIEDSDGNVFVYYERNTYPTDEDITIEDISMAERTIARAVCMNGSDTWESSPVMLQNADGTETYRITEVVPFSHDGIVGEALVVDLDGQLLAYDASSDSFEPSIEDRQIFIRLYANEDGTETTAIVPITESDTCAQNVQVISDDERLYMFWNQNGEIVYLSDFAETKAEYTEGASAAVVVVDPESKEVTIPDQPDGIGFNLASNSNDLEIGTDYSVSMSSDGDVLLCWVGDQLVETEDSYMTNEIFGLMMTTTENESGLKELDAVGNAIALTDEDSEIRSLDSVCTSNDNFLLAYAQLDGASIAESTKASVRAVTSTFEPQLTVTDVSADEYPLPGSEMTVKVTVRNDGLKALNNVKVNVKGVGSAQSISDEPLEAGCERTIDLTVSVPENFSKTSTLTATVRGTGMQSLISAKGTTEVKYDAYFVPVEMANVYNIPNTSNYVSSVQVKNIGNAAGIPEVSYLNYLAGASGQENGMKSDSTTGSTEISAGGTGRVNYILKDQIATADNITYLKVSLGDGYDQAVEGIMPTPKSTVMPESEKHTVTIAATEGGNVTVSPRQANAGETVILTANAFEGYTLSEISVTDSSGNVVTCKGSAGTYSFVMPDSDVTVNAVFKSTSAAHPFVDVSDSDWFADAVQYVYDNGLMTGVDATHFAPYMYMTRAMMMQVLYSREGKPEVSGQNFTDVAEDEWYADAVLWASQNGLTAGYGDGTFGPNDKVTREQIATMLRAYAEWKQMEKKDSGITLDQFADASSISSWAQESMLWAVNQGIISGRPGGILDPRGYGTRAELAQMLYALFAK